MGERIDIAGGLSIPLEELRFSTSRSGGPGGQHVNVTASRVTLAWNLLDSPSLSDEQRERLRERLGHRLSSAGELQLSVETTRSQHRNRELAIARFSELLARSLQRDPVRHETRRPRSVSRQILEHKRQRSVVKKLRQRPQREHD
ncbi:MAG: alternative ribosome rescue aminoacyl-tRNA hydrolase ArfB [Myxococcota bacterium]|jgi:ribosome-associated protein|nr:alternative ribosome rescue aminoacyl-tRNA hydrolase ArfB [Myxococcota bacterium]